MKVEGNDRVACASHMLREDARIWWGVVGQWLCAIYLTALVECLYTVMCVILLSVSLRVCGLTRR